MYVEHVRNRNSPPAILVRESYRQSGKVKKRTIANITKWPQNAIIALTAAFQGKELVPRDELFKVVESKPHGHVELVLGVIGKLGLDHIISSRPSRTLNCVLAMIAERIIHPCSKLATTRLWHSTTLAQELNVEDVEVSELYDSLDWLLKRQRTIERKLAKRHLREEEIVLYDVSSSYYEGSSCPLARWGHNRDKKKGKLIIVYGLLTDRVGNPISVTVYPGNTGDCSTVADQVEKIRNAYGLSRVVLVGDRGMLTQTKIDTLKEFPFIGWVSALRSESIQSLVEEGDLQLSLFDKQNLAQISSSHFPAERLIACFNPLLESKRRHKRQALLEATEAALERIKREVERRTNKPLSRDEIGVKVGKVLNKYKMAKHFILTIEDNRFHYERDEVSIVAEQRLDGVYVVRTSEPEKILSDEDTVRSYKRLTEVEMAFRCLKGIDLKIRPIRHRTEAHVRAHIFLCMLAYYVERYLREKWKELLFEEENLEELRKTRDPVLPATPSDEVKKKKKVKINKDGFVVHSFETLIAELGTRCKNKCRLQSQKNSPHVYQITELKPLQRKAFELAEIKCTQ